MDLELIEALALSEDREAALAQLLPGSEDHDYYRCLHLQHRDALDEADAILRAWPERHGSTERYERLRLRQLLYRVVAEPARAADDVRDWLGVSHWHEAEVEDVAPARPTRLADGAFDGASLLQQALAADTTLSQVTDEGLHELISRTLDPVRRRILLSRLHHTAQPQIVALVAEDLAARGNSGFGSLAIHDQLTLDQLIALAQHRSELRAHLGWVSAVVRRMRPHHSIDLDVDLDARATYLDALWRFVVELPPVINTLRAHVLWHVLDTARRRDQPVDPALFSDYLQLPRRASYLSRRWLDKVRVEDVAQLGADHRNVTGLPPAGGDEELVRDLLFRMVAAGRDCRGYAPWLDPAWLDAELAEIALLQGDGAADRATLTLGPGRAAALRDRIELAWCVHNPPRFGQDEPIALDVDVKNIDELHVKVFRVDPIAYFQNHRREVNTDLDLDGLAASHELVMRFTEPAVRRVRRRIDLPMCARAGTYVIDLIGNGMSSRALVTKGRLRHVARLGAAGHVVTILDEAGAPRPDARVWIGDREYVPDARAAIAVPFSTAPETTPMLLVCGDIATIAQLELVRETYELTINLVLDRGALSAGRTAIAIARVALTVAGAPASLALVKRATWDVTVRDLHGVATTKSRPLVVGDDGAAVLEWPLGDDVSNVAITVRGTVEVRSEQREQELADTRSVSIAAIHGTDGIDVLYLARTPAGWVFHALGKTGEPRAHRPLTVSLVHRWTRIERNVELATDADGRIELGPLPGVEWITATIGDFPQRWLAGDYGLSSTIHVAAGGEVLVPVPPGRSSAEVLRRASLVEYRGGTVARHPKVETELLEGGIAIRGLPAGDYELRAPGVHVAISVAPAGPEITGCIVAPGEIIETPRAMPVVAAISHAGDLAITLRGAGPRTRVHAIATRFASALSEWFPLGGVRTPGRRVDRARASIYVSGRELGDEVRYVLERRGAKRYPNLMLDKPSLLLNPWSRRTTTTDIADGRAGDAFGSFAPPPGQPASYGSAGPGQSSRQAQDPLASYDFLATPPAVLANLVPDARGTVHIPRNSLGDATSVTIIVDDPAGALIRRCYFAETPLAPRDLRLRLALDAERHATQKKAIAPLRTGDRLVIEDLSTAKLHLIDSVERAHGYLLALRDDPALREFAFVTRWHTLPDAERRERYSKYACHELHLFLWFKDRPFFDEVIRPYLANKRTKTFVDHWLLGDDLAAWLEPARLARLNAVERALLAHRLDAADALPRILGDEVAIMPPDPGLDTRLIDTLLGAATLDPDTKIEQFKVSARQYQAPPGPPPRMAPAGAMPSSAAMSSSPHTVRRDLAAPNDRASPARGPANNATAHQDEFEDESTGEIGGEGGGDFGESSPDMLDRDLAMREEAAPHYRAVDKTQEWAEHNWWHRSPAQSGPDMIRPNRLWRDLARQRDGQLLSPWLGLATASFAEAMCALAVTDLPFVPAQHQIASDTPRLTITAGGNALAGSSQILDGELVPGGPPLVVGTSYVRTHDRHDFSSGQPVEKYVEGPFAVGVVYTCQVVLANPTSARQRISALVQIPRGSLPVDRARVTHTLDVLLEPYGIHGHEYAFYFPAPGRWSHFPVHVSRGETIVAAAPGRTLEVVSGGGTSDPTSWPHVSQRGTVAEVVAYLTAANLAATDLTRVAWRMRDRAAFEAITHVLEQRRAYDATLWAYALVHHDAPRLRVWLRSQGDRLLAAGPVLEMLDLDAEDLGRYEHLELAPLVNARTHRLGGRLRILNDGLAAQYGRFLDLVAHRRAPTAEDLLAAAAYLVTQDRVDAALAALARVPAGAVADRMQHDYLAAYTACLTGELARARALATPWRDHPVDRWRHRFAALLAMLDEVEGAAPVVVDPRSREQLHAELAAKQPAFDIALDRDGVLVHSQQLTALELRFFEMDVELLFSRQPFVQSDVSRFSFIEPGHRELFGPLPPEHRVPWPAQLRGKNVVVEAVGAGQRKGRVHYANDLTLNLSHQVGQVRVQRASDRSPLPATYVKVYARKHGAVAFYKDGYTDLRGWFDYASLSTTDLDSVERFAILVCSDHAGAAILEASPPVR